MQTRTRGRRPQERPLAEATPEQASRVGEPNPTPDRAGDLLRAADDAINRVISDDASKFLADSRQQGGQ